MVKACINKAALAKLGGSVDCFMADDNIALTAKSHGSTRAAAAMDKAADMKGN